PIDDDLSVQTYLARNVAPGAKLSFRISGTGQLPQETAAPQGSPSGQAGSAEAAPANPAAAAQAAAENNTRPGIGLGVPIDTPDPLQKYKWWIISLAVVLLAIGAGISMRRTSQPANLAEMELPTPPLRAITPPPARIDTLSDRPSVDRSAGLLEILKEEVFNLESERIQGRISAEEYERQKAA